LGSARLRVEAGAGEKTAVYQEVVSFPLASARSLGDLRRYRGWANPDWFDYACVREQVTEARQTGKVIVFMGDRMNRCAQLKPAMYLRGIEQILLDLSQSPEIADYIIQRVAEFYLEYARRTFEAAGDGIDLFFYGDDFGTQNGMFISPTMWRRFLRPGFHALVELGKRYGYWVAHHSCGSIKPIIPDLIDCGLDILNPIQPDVYDMNRLELKRLFGDRSVFMDPSLSSVRFPSVLLMTCGMRCRNALQAWDQAAASFSALHIIFKPTPLSGTLRYSSMLIGNWVGTGEQELPFISTFGTVYL